MKPSPGFVFWLTGLSAAGKTTISRELVKKLKSENIQALFLDGDELREMYGNDLGHSMEDRRQGAMRNARLCKLLSDQGLNVVCATISLFHECQQWNRANIPNYKEIFLSVPMEILVQRDPKSIYANARNQKSDNVMGLDIQPQFPRHPDLTLVNDGTKTPEQMAQIIFEQTLSPRSKAA